MTDEPYITHLAEDECWDLLRTHPVGRVAWSDGAAVTVLPVNHVVHERTLWFRADPDSVLGRLAEGASVAFEADQIDDETRIAWSVLVRGHASGAEESGIDGRVVPEPWAPGERTLDMRITVEEISGRVLSGQLPNYGA